MKKSKPAKLLLGVLGLATFASLVGTVSGTLAWYAYSTRATVSYSGTSVNNTVQLQIGIVSPDKMMSLQDIRDQNARIIAQTPDITFEEKEELQKLEGYFEEFWDVMEETKWDNDNNYYYFAPIGSGLESPIINAYLKSNGFATNCLIPVTSGAFKRGDAFTLKKAPQINKPANDSAPDSSYYATIPFVFRVIRSNTTETNKYVPNIELWLTDAKIKASSDVNGDIYKAVRMFVDRSNDYEDDFIMNPSASSNGKTVVGGLLDLTRDFYYDYDENNNEIIYGEYESIGGIKNDYSGPDQIDDINDTRRTECDSFTAKHRNGINYYDSYDGCVFKNAEYECLKSIAPVKDEITGVLRNKDVDHPTSVCITGDDNDHCLGRVDFTIYLEGWDHTVIDEEMGHYFDLGLTFEINKLGA